MGSRVEAVHRFRYDYRGERSVLGPGCLVHVCAVRKGYGITGFCTGDDVERGCERELEGGEVARRTFAFLESD